MARAHRLGAITSCFAAIYLLIFFQILSVPFVSDTAIQEILPVIPWWLLVSFGSFSLWSLGMGLYTFRDCPEAYDELLGEINEAKNDLRARGITVD